MNSTTQTPRTARADVPGRIVFLHAALRTSLLVAASVVAASGFYVLAAGGSPAHALVVVWLPAMFVPASVVTASTLYYVGANLWRHEPGWPTDRLASALTTTAWLLLLRWIL